MKVKSIASILISVFFITASMVSCSGGQTTSQGQQGQGSKDEGFGVAQARSALTDLTYSPYGKGFQYKIVSVPPGDFRNWLGQFRPQIEQALKAVGDGYVLQVTGHTCSIGPREAEPNLGKKGNIWYSTERAKNVFNALNSLGIPTDKMSVVGVADDEPLPGIDTKDQRNRRVTFKIVPATKK